MPLTYAAALDFLFPRVTTIKFGLDTTRALLSAVGNPHELIPVVHVGGTNGKGSVATLIAAALEEAGWKVGLYTSPHLVSFRERIKVAGQPISEDAVATWTAKLQPVIEELGATFFEATTAIAFADFAARGAEIAVVEVGLGGRLDSTNVVQPLVSVVTKIAMDHMKYLGDSLEAIAGEKAGIAKPGVPFVIGEADPKLVSVLVRRGAEHAGGPVDARIVPPGAQWEGKLALLGPHQRRNAAVALTALDALPSPWRPAADAIERGFARAFIAGRFDRRGRWLFDVAHNPDGIRTMVEALADLKPARPIHALVSILGDKAWEEMLVTLDLVVDRGILTQAPTASERGWNFDWLDQWLADPVRPRARARWTVEPDFKTAIRKVQEGAGTVLVTGSFHTVGDVMQEVGMMP